METIPIEAGQGWKLEIHDLLAPTLSHYHLIQKEIIVVVDGAMKILGNDLKSGELIAIQPGQMHSLVPEEKARFVSISLPGLNADRYDDENPPPEVKWAPYSRDFFPLIHPHYFGERQQRQGTYWVYDIITGEMTDGKWSLALIEILDTPKHFHHIESEQFIVVNGVLDIEIDGSRRILEVGESVETLPGMVHHLKSADKNPVRVLCFSFPAFSISDKHYVE